MFTATLSVRSLFFAFGLVGLGLLAVESRAETYTVTETADSSWPNPDPSILSLRVALSNANQHPNQLPGLDLIVIPEGTYTLTIPGSGDDNNLSGDLDIRDSVIIQGAGPDKTIIDGGALDRVFDLPYNSSSIRVFMSNLTIQNGKLTNVTGGLDFEGGGGINNQHHLYLSNVVVKNNTVEGAGGGGIENKQDLTLNKVVLRENIVTGETSSCNGGGILNIGSLVVTDALVSGNRAHGGGGLFNAGLVTATIERSLFTENQASYGSALLAYGRLELVNTTIHGNNFTLAGGGRCALLVRDTATVSFCTITDNLTTDTVQSSGLCTSSTSQLTLRGTVLAGNKRIGIPTQNNCTFFTPPLSATYNLEDANTCGFSPATNLVSTDPKLGPLQDNGGPTQTRALAADSPAIDYVRIDTGVTVDQRGFKRPVGPWADIGAYEYEPPVCFPVRSPDGKTAIICL